MTFRQGKHTFARIPRRALADQPKLQKLRQMAAELDIDILSGHLDSGMKGLKEKVLGPEFHRGIKTGLAEMGIAAAVGAFGGGYGKVAALGIEVGGLLRGLTGKKSAWGKLAPQKGQWVAIHNGIEHARQKLQKSWGGGKFMDARKQSAVEVKFTTPISIGFYVREGQVPGTKVVFNFQTAVEEARILNELLVLGPARQRALDGNSTLAKLKGLVLGSDALPLRLQGGVNVDEGSEVVYRDEVYTVQDCDGFDAEIKNRLRTITVPVGKLSAGRVEHTNSWNAARNTDGGFAADSRAAFYKGQWVWLPPRASTRRIYPRAHYELGVLRLINGARGDGYYAVDGLRFQTVLANIQACPKVDQEWMRLSKPFMQFQIAAVKGIDVVRQKLGRDHILEVLGIKTVGTATVKQHGTTPHKQPEKAVMTKLGKMLEVEARNETTWPYRPEDKAADARAHALVKKELQDKLRIPNVTAGALAEDLHHPLKDTGSNLGTSSYVFGVVVVLGAVYLIMG